MYYIILIALKSTFKMNFQRWRINIPMFYFMYISNTLYYDHVYWYRMHNDIVGVRAVIYYTHISHICIIWSCYYIRLRLCWQSIRKKIEIKKKYINIILYIGYTCRIRFLCWTAIILYIITIYIYTYIYCQSFPLYILYYIRRNSL